MMFVYYGRMVVRFHLDLFILIVAIPFRQLPDFLGGSCTCPVEGDCLRSNTGLWNDPEIMKDVDEDDVVVKIVEGDKERRQK
nr:hypothetical protein [Tanacetum cinerariifolium]